MRTHGRPVLGAIAGLFFGIFVAADLAQWAVRPLDSMSVIVLPIVGAVLGIVLGMWAPLGRRGSKAAPRPEPITPAAPVPSETKPMTPSSPPEDDQ